MNRRAGAAVLIACFMLSSAACNKAPSATVVTVASSFGTEKTGGTSQGFMDAIYENAVLTSDTGNSYDFKYDCDIFAYTGQGGNFYLVGSDATKCFLHIIIEDQTDDSFDEAKKAYEKSITKEFTLGSGHRAFIYTTSDANNIHVIIDAGDLVSSGKGLINIYIGSVESWPYTGEQIADQVDKGF